MKKEKMITEPSPGHLGSTLIIRNNGVINMASGKEFIAPVGTIVNIESGEIN